MMYGNTNREIHTNYNQPLALLLSILSPFWDYANKDLEIDTWHWAREHRKVLLVEKVIDCAFQREVGPTE